MPSVKMESTDNARANERNKSSLLISQRMQPNINEVNGQLTLKYRKVKRVKWPDNKSDIKAKLLHVGIFVSTRRKICYYA